MAQFGPAMLAAVFALDFALNLSQAALFHRYGFVAAIVLRIAFYAVWHIMYVH
jgi:hypothetical protein